MEGRYHHSIETSCDDGRYFTRMIHFLFTPYLMPSTGRSFRRTAAYVVCHKISGLSVQFTEEFGKIRMQDFTRPTCIYLKLTSIG